MYSALPLPFDDEIEKEDQREEQSLKNMGEEAIQRFYEEGLRSFDNIVWPVKKIS